jgi:hypothetical protein
MFADPSETLTHFFGIPAKQLARDCAAAELDRLGDAIRADLTTPEEDRTATAAPEHLHHLLLHAVAAGQAPNLGEEKVAFFATWAAHQVADLAGEVAASRGRLGELNRRLELRDDPVENDDDPAGDAPIDPGQGGAAELEAEADRLFDAIAGTVFATVLRRYGFDSMADLFESDRAAFDAKVEAGRRLIHGNTSA